MCGSDREVKSRRMHESSTCGRQSAGGRSNAASCGPCGDVAWAGSAHTPTHARERSRTSGSSTRTPCGGAGQPQQSAATCASTCASLGMSPLPMSSNTLGVQCIRSDVNTERPRIRFGAAHRRQASSAEKNG